MGEFGVYVLANDVTAEWLEACLRSLRLHHPALPVCVIPFDDRLQRVEGIAARNGAVVWRDASLVELDRLGATLTDREVEIRYFRKLATFWGPFENFLYLDADIVVLGPHLERWLETFSRAASDFVYYNSDIDQVFRPGPLREAMIAAGSKAFNAGMFMSRRGALPRERVESSFAPAQRLLPEFSRNVEQAFFNWLAVEQGLRVHALLELLPEFAPVSWYRCRVVRRGGRYFQPWDGELRPMALLHWAGVALPFLAHHRIFLRSRLRGEPALRRLAYRLRWYLGALSQALAGR